MSPDAELPQEDLEKLIGYEFREKEILKNALTRRAYWNDKQSKNNENMDPLATLGDSILDAVAVHRLYEKEYRKKKDLTEEKSKKVKREKTRAFAEKYKLRKYVRWGDGEVKNKIWKSGDRALDTVCEALIGSVFLDAQRNNENGLNTVKEMLDRMEFFE